MATVVAGLMDVVAVYKGDGNISYGSDDCYDKWCDGYGASHCISIRCGIQVVVLAIILVLTTIIVVMVEVIEGDVGMVVLEGSIK